MQRQKPFEEVKKPKEEPKIVTENIAITLP
jgi:hypothetical protein